MRPNFTCIAHPHVTFHATQLPHQHVRKHVDLLAYEVLASAARRTRSAYADLRSYDWNLFQLAAGKLSTDELGLVSAAQYLSMGSAARRLLHQGAGNGSRPFCGAQDSGIIHEAWACPGLTKHQNAADEYLIALRPGVVSHHLLLGSLNNLASLTMTSYSNPRALASMQLTRLNWSQRRLFLGRLRTCCFNGGARTLISLLLLYSGLQWRPPVTRCVPKGAPHLIEPLSA